MTQPEGSNKKDKATSSAVPITNEQATEQTMSDTGRFAFEKWPFTAAQGSLRYQLEVEKFVDEALAGKHTPLDDDAKSLIALLQHPGSDHYHLAHPIFPELRTLATEPRSQGNESIQAIIDGMKDHKADPIVWPAELQPTVDYYKRLWSLTVPEMLNEAFGEDECEDGCCNPWHTECAE